MGQLTNTWTGPVVGTHVPDPSGMNKNDSTEPRMGTGAQLKNDWAGPQEGTHVPDPSGMDANTWTGPVVGTGPTNERDGSGMIAQDVSTTYKTDSQGNPTTELMTRGEEQLHEALAAGGSFDKQMSGMDNVTTVGGWATDMAQDGLFADPDTKSPKWPKAGEQVPDPFGMDTVDDHFPAMANLGRIIEADKEKACDKCPPIGETTIG